ncbi:MAG: S-layer homology domain-containing protein [Armatimonadetes bacterium]|nr:S-layer homology domain-containing protein [Candidatus Hippobium faecium]
MKKILMLIAAVIVMAAPAFAQSAFSDVPRDHWAYGAVSQLENAGLVVGYPDGTFKGKRTLTRYEFAMVLAKLLPFLTEDGTINVSGFATKQDLDGYAKLSDIKGADLSGVASKADLDAIAKLANEFKAELTSLGVDINSLNADVNALRSRVAALEDEQARVVVTGDLNVGAKYGFKNDALLLDYDRALQVEGSQGTLNVKDFQINVKGRVNNNINAYLSLVAGDYMKKVVDPEMIATWATDVNTASDVTVLPYYMYATVDMNKWGDFRLGRMPFQINKYVYKRYDSDSYFDIARMDNGDYAVDGVDYTKDFGVVDVRAWLAQPQHSMFEDHTLDFAYGLTSPVKVMAGAQLGFNISSARVEALINYNEALKNWFSYDGRAISKIYGATLNVPMGSFTLDGAYFQQKTQDLDKYLGSDKDNPTMFDVKGTLDWNGLVVDAGYRQVELGYEAPADWEAMAYIHNPSNVKGFYADAAYAFGNFDVFGAYKQYKLKDDFGFSIDEDKITYWKAGVDYNTGKIGKFGVKYEQLKNYGEKSNYLTVSWAKKVGNANFKLAYQNVNNKDLDNKGNILYGQAGYSF